MFISNSSSLSDEQLKKLLSPLSHDLKNYLTMISLHAQLLEKKLMGNPEAASVVKIKKGIENLEGHLNIFSEIIKLYYQETKIELKPLSLANLSSDLSGLVMDGQLVNKVQECSKINIDPVRLKRVLISLISLLQPESCEIKLEQTGDQILIEVKGHYKASPTFSSDVILATAGHTLELMKSNFHSTSEGDSTFFKIKIPLYTDT